MCYLSVFVYVLLYIQKRMNAQNITGGFDKRESHLDTSERLEKRFYQWTHNANMDIDDDTKNIKPLEGYVTLQLSYPVTDSLSILPCNDYLSFSPYQ